MRIKRVLALCLAALMCASGAHAELKKGDRGGKVVQVQDELYARGYLQEEGDGQYGQRTEAAVKVFQSENELEVTGVVDDTTYEMLIHGEEAHRRKARERLVALGYLDAAAEEITIESIRKFQQANGMEPTGELDEATLAQMASGDAKSDIARVQERLIELGYLQGAADGKFGEGSKAALKLFQQANGLEVTGELDDVSREAALSPDAIGDTVRMLQQRLIQLGYLQGTADGAFGRQSIAALKKFQQAHGLEETGESNDETWSMLFSDSAKAVYPTLNSVSTNAAAIRRLQQKLIDLGFLGGRADGDYGGATYSAVLAYQERMAGHGYEIGIEGEADSEIQSMLFSGEYSTYISDILPADEGGEVLRAERRLVQLGYMDAAADERYDDYAVECMKAFQSGAGLEVTGIADRATIDHLFSEDAAQAQQYVLHEVRMGESSAVVKYAQNALIRMGLYDQYASMAGGTYNDLTEAALERLYGYLAKYNPRQAETFAARESLSAAAVRALMEAELIVCAADIGAESEESEIARVQRRLRGLYYDVEIDGKFGESTIAAVEAFQADNGLEVTGIADRDTQRRLFSEKAVGNWTEYMLKVSIDDQRVYVYQLDEEKQYRQIDAFICSTGLDNTTPRGIFSETTEPLDRWHYFIEFECWAQYAWRIEGLIYFHSVIYSEKDESTLRMSSVYNLGRKASHGCVRLQVEDAKWIYDHCDAGTIVIIY